MNEQEEHSGDEGGRQNNEGTAPEGGAVVPSDLQDDERKKVKESFGNSLDDGKDNVHFPDDSSSNHDHNHDYTNVNGTGDGEDGNTNEDDAQKLISFLESELTYEDDVQTRIFAARNCGAVARKVGPEACRNLLLPMLQRFCDAVDDNEVVFTLSEALSHSSVNAVSTNTINIMDRQEERQEEGKELNDGKTLGEEAVTEFMTGVEETDPNASSVRIFSPRVSQMGRVARVSMAVAGATARQEEEAGEQDDDGEDTDDNGGSNDNKDNGAHAEMNRDGKGEESYTLQSGRERESNTGDMDANGATVEASDKQERKRHSSRRTSGTATGSAAGSRGSRRRWGRSTPKDKEEQEKGKGKEKGKEKGKGKKGRGTEKSFPTAMAMSSHDTLEQLDFVGYVGGASYATALLPLLQSLAMNSETMIRERGLETLEIIVGNISYNEYDTIGLLEQMLSTAKNFQQKISICSLTCVVIRSIQLSKLTEPQLITSDEEYISAVRMRQPAIDVAQALNIVERLAADPTPMVKAAVAQRIPKLCFVAVGSTTSPLQTTVVNSMEFYFSATITHERQRRPSNFSMSSAASFRNVRSTHVEPPVDSEVKSTLISLMDRLLQDIDPSVQQSAFHGCMLPYVELLPMEERFEKAIAFAFKSLDNTSWHLRHSMALNMHGVMVLLGNAEASKRRKSRTIIDIGKQIQGPSESTSSKTSPASQVRQEMQDTGASPLSRLTACLSELLRDPEAVVRKAATENIGPICSFLPLKTVVNQLWSGVMRGFKDISHEVRHEAVKQSTILLGFSQMFPVSLPKKNRGKVLGALRHRLIDPDEPVQSLAASTYFDTILPQASVGDRKRTLSVLFKKMNQGENTNRLPWRVTIKAVFMLPLSLKKGEEVLEALDFLSAVLGHKVAAIRDTAREQVTDLEEPMGEVNFARYVVPRIEALVKNRKYLVRINALACVESLVLAGSPNVEAYLRIVSAGLDDRVATVRRKAFEVVARIARCSAIRNDIDNLRELVARAADTNKNEASDDVVKARTLALQNLGLT